MREIKYRAKCAGGWVYGIPCKDPLGFWMIRDTEGRERYIDKETLGQYTGLKDRHGREIYEGDILMTEAGACDFAEWAHGTVTFIREVVYDGDLARFEPFSEYDRYDWEVVGNIHDRTLSYDGKKYKALLIPADGLLCGACSRHRDSCHIGFNASVCDVFGGLMDEKHVVVLEEVHDEDSLR